MPSLRVIPCLPDKGKKKKMLAARFNWERGGGGFYQRGDDPERPRGDPNTSNSAIGGRLSLGQRCSLTPRGPVDRAGSTIPVFLGINWGGQRSAENARTSRGNGAKMRGKKIAL